MQAHVKTPHIKIEIDGEIPPSIIKILKKEYGEKAIFTYNKKEHVNIRDTDWFKKMEKTRTSGMAVKVYRDNSGMTQDELGRKLGGLSRQKISDIENSRRPISIEMAEQFAKIFKVPVERFL